MTDSLGDVRRRTVYALRALEDVTAQAFTVWRDDIAISFDREYLAPLREAAIQLEKALRVASQAEDRIDTLPSD